MTDKEPSEAAMKACPGSIHGERGAIPCVCLGIQAAIDAAVQDAEHELEEERRLRLCAENDMHNMSIERDDAVSDLAVLKRRITKLADYWAQDGVDLAEASDIRRLLSPDPDSPTT